MQAAPMHQATPLRPALPLRILAIAGVAVAYFLAARLLISLSVDPSGAVTTIWVPSGIAVAALVLLGPWAVVGAFLGSLAVALAMQTPPPAAVAVALGNAGGEFLCYWLLARWRGKGFSIANVSDGPRLVAAAAAAGVLSASVSVSAFIAYGLIPAQAFLANWLAWVGSGVSSIVLVAPLIVYLKGSHRPWMARARIPEYLAALCLLMAAAFLWQGPLFTRGVNEPVVLLLIAGQLWIAFRFAPAAMTLPNCAIAAAAVVALVLRLGQAPKASASPFILSLQLMLVGLALTGYFLSAMLARQREATRALQEAQGAVVNAARNAGKAEVATNVLHNVGNVLNSVNVSARLLADRLRTSKVHGLARAVQMLQARSADLGDYLTKDEKGRLIPTYLAQVSAGLEQEQREQLAELRHLDRNIEHIKAIVATQQTHAGVSTVLETVQLSDLVEDALRLDQDALTRDGVTVVREFTPLSPALLDRTRIVQILVNLVKNARQAVAGSDGARRITVRTGQEGSRLTVSVRDEGEGIPPENLTLVFAHGFTTRQGGHGFGLHSCAVAAGEMGSSLSARSEGLGRGATFTLELPLKLPPAGR